MKVPVDGSEERNPSGPGAGVTTTNLIPIDFLADPEVVRVVAEGERLANRHLFNPVFATEISLIDPLPHQRIAVYDRILPQQARRPWAGWTSAGCSHAAAIECNPPTDPRLGGIG